ncbi:putative disease resistance protein [Senna tora]|uniref:Putative disease resistance protein n=1 Tax=Senna tora TaxID=362788 RepID=A0A834T3F5_9FABA|nr:putative disease resistance protein [Senna tora]
MVLACYCEFLLSFFLSFSIRWFKLFVEMAEVVLSIAAKVLEYLVDPAIREGYYLFPVNERDKQ